MNTNLIIFENKEFGKVRTILINNEPYFVGKDVAEVLGYEDINKAVAMHVYEEDREVLKYKAYDKIAPALWDNKNDFSNKTVINESGLYSLIFSSKLPKAKEFKRWVTSEVLPSIRKNGMYAKEELLDNPDLLLEVVTKLKAERDARKEAEAQRDKLIHQNKLYTSSEIAKELGFKSAMMLNKILSDKHIQYKQNGTWLLYSDYSDMNLVSIKQITLENEKIVYDRRWTGTGRDFILNLFKK